MLAESDHRSLKAAERRQVCWQAAVRYLHIDFRVCGARKRKHDTRQFERAPQRHDTPSPVVGRRRRRHDEPECSGETEVCITGRRQGHGSCLVGSPSTTSTGDVVAKLSKENQRLVNAVEATR